MYVPAFFAAGTSSVHSPSPILYWTVPSFTSVSYTHLKIKEVIHTPYIIILIPLSIISTVLFLLAEEEESSTCDKIKPLFIINFTLWVLWTVILNYIIFERDIFVTISEVLINYLVANFVFASVMTIISLIINSIFEYLIDYSEGFLKFLLLFFCVFTCILIAVHA